MIFYSNPLAFRLHGLAVFRPDCLINTICTDDTLHDKLSNLVACDRCFGLIGLDNWSDTRCVLAWRIQDPPSPVVLAENQFEFFGQRGHPISTRVWRTGCFMLLEQPQTLLGTRPVESSIVLLLSALQLAEELVESSFNSLHGRLLLLTELKRPQTTDPSRSSQRCRPKGSNSLSWNGSCKFTRLFCVGLGP